MVETGLSVQNTLQLPGSLLPESSVGSSAGINGQEMEEVTSGARELTQDTQNKLRAWLLDTPIFKSLNPQIQKAYQDAEVRKAVQGVRGKTHHIIFEPKSPLPADILFRASARLTVSQQLAALFGETFSRMKGVEIELDFHRPIVHPPQPRGLATLPVEPKESVILRSHHYKPPRPLLTFYEELLDNSASGVYFIHQPSGSGGAEEIFLLEAQRIAKAQGMATGKLSCSSLKSDWQQVGKGLAQGEPIADAFKVFFDKDRLVILEHAESFFRKSDGNLSGAGTVEKVMEQVDILLKQQNRKTVIIFVGSRSDKDLLRAAKNTHDDIISPLCGVAGIRMKTSHDPQGYDLSYDNQEVRRAYMLYHLRSSLSTSISLAGSGQEVDLFKLQPDLGRYNAGLFVSEGLSILFRQIAPMRKILKKMMESESFFDIGSLSKSIQYHESDCNLSGFLNWLDEWVRQLLEPHFPGLTSLTQLDTSTPGATMHVYLVLSSLIHLCSDSYELDLGDVANPLAILRERIFQKVFHKIPGISEKKSIQFCETLVGKLDDFGVNKSVRFSLLNTVFTLGAIPYGSISEWNMFVQKMTENIRSPKKINGATD